MAMTNLPAPIPLWDMSSPYYTPGMGGAVFVINAASEKAAIMIQAPKTGTINKIGFYVGAYASTATLECEVQTVSSSTIFPTGTKFGSSTTATVSVTGTGWFEATLATGAAVTKGDRIALVVSQPASSPGDCAIGNHNWYYDTNSRNYPAGAHYTSSWAAAASFARPIIYPGYDDSTYGFMPANMPLVGISSTSVNTGTNPDEVGNVFTLPVPLRIIGARVFLNPGGDGRDFTLKLYDSGGSVLASETFDTAVFHTGWSMWADLLFDAAVDCSAALHRMTLLPTTASSMTVNYVTMPNVTGIRHAMPSGADAYWTYQNNGGGFSDTNTQLMALIPLIGGVDNGAGGGGGLAANPIRGFLA